MLKKNFQTLLTDNYYTIFILSLKSLFWVKLEAFDSKKNYKKEIWKRFLSKKFKKNKSTNLFQQLVFFFCFTDWYNNARVYNKYINKLHCKCKTFGSQELEKLERKNLFNI